MLAKLLTSAILAFCVVSCSCGLPNRNVTRTVDPQELIAVWELTQDSLVLLKRDGYKPLPNASHRIELQDNGRMTFKTVYTASDRFEHVTAEGTWAVKNGNNLSLKFGLPNQDIFENYGITEENGKLLLWTYHGDPDLWEFIEYSRGNAG